MKKNNFVNVFVLCVILIVLGSNAKNQRNVLAQSDNSLYEILPATLTEVVDSLGNVNTNSWTKGTGGGWSCGSDCPDLELSVGDVVNFTATALDPNGLPLEYRFEYIRNGNLTTAQDWSSDNTFEWHVSIEDVGPWNGISAHVRNNDGSDWQGEWNGDDYNCLQYKVIDPNTSPATLTEVVDSLGNVNTNSLTKGTGVVWSCGSDCPDLELSVGDVVIFTATASDPKGLPLEYRFEYIRNGNLTIAQDWSSDNTFEWHVSTEDVGDWNGISAHVRNNDGLGWQSEWNGDDYNYLQYKVINPNTSPATLTEVVDSLGNVNTNSLTKGTGVVWSCGSDCPDLELSVGDVVTFTATASDPNGLPLEYRFEYMRNGSMTTAQDWSSDNTFEWHVSIEDVGPWNGISAHVRNNDGSDWQGEWNGDDYNYLTYAVYNLFIDELSPDSSEVGSSTITMEIDGDNFEADSKVQFGDSILATTYINPTTLSAIVPENLLQTAGEFSVKVIDSSPDGDESNVKSFRVARSLFIPIIQR